MMQIMAAEPAEAALAAAVSPPTKEIIAVHRAEYSNIRQMAMDGLLEDDRKNARLDAADNRYDVAMEERRKGRERKRVQAEAKAAKEASSDDADYGSPKPSAKKRKIERKSAKSASKSGPGASRGANRRVHQPVVDPERAGTATPQMRRNQRREACRTQWTNSSRP